MIRRLLAPFMVAAGCSGLFVVALASPAAACSCAVTTDEEAYASADAVFVGDLVEVRTPSGQSYSSADPERFVFEVDRVYKGRAYETQAIVTARDGASCGLEISGRGPFLVFAHNDGGGLVESGFEGELFSNLCGGTRAFADGSLPSGFGSEAAPAPGSSPIGSAEGDSNLVPVVIVVGIVALAGLSGLFVARRVRAKTPE